MSKREVVSLVHKVRTEVTTTYEVDPDHFKEVTGTELYDATSWDLEDYVLDNYTSVVQYDYVEEQFLDETLQSDWILEH